MNEGQKHLIQFGQFSLDPSNRSLLRDGQPVPLHPKAFDMLMLLVERRDEVVGKDELMHRLWPDSFVEESNLTQNIYVLRKALGQTGAGQEFIKTVPKRGYRFVGEVRELRGDGDLILEEQVTSRITIDEQIEADANPKVDAAEATSTSLSSRAKWLLGVGMLVLGGTVVLVGGLFAYRFATRGGLWSTKPAPPAIEPFKKMKIARLTDSGKAHCPAISPDGKYLAYVIREDPGGNSLWIKHLPTGSATQIVPPATGVELEGVVFSKDGGFIYYSHNEKTLHHLYQVPVLGGPPRKLIDNVWGRVGLSPDGKKLAFLRARWNEGEHFLMIADADGANERIIATRTRPQYFNVFGVGPEWSPDGRLIALSGASGGDGGYEDVIEVVVESGAQRVIPGPKWHSVGQVVWLTDGSGLLIAARERNTPTQQVWLLSYPDGSAQRVTNDLNYYERLSLTSDSGILVAEQSEHVSNIWVAASEIKTSAPALRDGLVLDSSRAAQITTGKNGRDGFYGVTWTPDGEVIFSTSAGGSGYDLWIAKPGGSEPRQLTFGGGHCLYPSVSPDGRYIVFSSDRAGERNIWRSDRDGRNLLRLTSGRNELHSSFTPDGHWVVYDSGDTTSHLWKVSIEGGTPQRLNEKYASGNPVVSPDGLMVAFGYHAEDEETPWRLGVMRFDSGEMVRSFPQPFRSFHWTTDGKSLTYISGTSSVSNIWSQPLDGGPPKQLTSFKEKRIYWFDWSRDGEWLALARGESSYDLVMISEFR